MENAYMLADEITFGCPFCCHFFVLLPSAQRN